MSRSCKLSEQGLLKAKQAFKQSRFSSQGYLAIELGIHRQTLIKFFQRKSIDKKNFQSICKELKLAYIEVVELNDEEIKNKIIVQSKVNMSITQSQPEEKTNWMPVNQSIGLTLETIGANLKTLTEAEEKHFKKDGKAVIVVDGNLMLDEQVEFNGTKISLKILIEELNKKGFSLQIVNTQEGSVKITVNDSSENLDRLNALFKSGDLVQVLGIPIKKIELDKESEENDIEDDYKLQLIERVIAGEVSGDDLIGVDLSGAFLCRVNLQEINLKAANLVGADLSEADLWQANLLRANLREANLRKVYLRGAKLQRGDLWKADLRGADLRGANLWGANLQQANLREANLWGANLQEANLQEANLEKADLWGVDLREADLTDALVVDTLFSGATGITPEMQRDLERRGAIFGDKPRVTV